MIPNQQASSPTLSVAVVCHRMERQIGNTLRSLLPPYQRNITVSEFEIMLVDNGSPEPLAEEDLAARFEYLIYAYPTRRCFAQPGCRTQFGGG